MGEAWPLASDSGEGEKRLGQGHRGDVAELWAAVGGQRLQEVAGVAEGRWAPDWGCIEVTAKTKRADEGGAQVGPSHPLSRLLP